MSPDEEQLYASISVLSSQVSRLQDEITSLDGEIILRKNLLSNTDNANIILAELLKIIESKKILLDSISTEIDDIMNRRELLLKECNDAEIIVIQKNNYVSDIDKLKNDFNILQNDIESFENTHSNKKKIALLELDSIRNKIKELHSHIGEAVIKL